jgi:hypothetical protein
MKDLHEETLPYGPALWFLAACDILKNREGFCLSFLPQKELNGLFASSEMPNIAGTVANLAL